MFGNKYLYLAVLSINLALGVCYVNYNLFQGFEPTPVTLKTFWWHHVQAAENTTVKPKVNVSTTVNDETSTIPNTVTSRRKEKRKQIGRKEIDFTSDYNFYLTTPEAKQWKPKINVNQFNMKCPENELSSSIGTYLIPTQRDLVLFTQRTLLKMFNGYHEKTLLLLKDIKEATRATVAVEQKCNGRGKSSYKLCVQEVNKKFVSVTKELVQSLERQEAEVIALTEDKICNLTSMKTNPIQLIKILAMDEASLVFALPAFLRLLGGCTVHCNKPASPDHRPRLRQMTDQELLVKHFLTSKTYLQLLKDKYV